MKRAIMKRWRWIGTLGLIAAGGAGIASLLAGSPPPVGSLVTLAHDGDPASTAIAFTGDSGSPRILTGAFAAASSPSVSFDGRRFLFVATSSPGDGPAIWEMRVDGSGARMVTTGNGAPSDPAWLPDGRILYSDRPGPAEQAPPGVRALFTFDPAAGASERLTYGFHRDVRPTLRDDGLVWFERFSPPDDEDAPGVLMTIRPDGTGFSLSPEPSRPLDDMADPSGITPPDGYTLVARRPSGPHPAPPMLTSVVNTGRRTGTLLCLDVRSSRLASVASLPPDAIASVRVSVIESEASAGSGSFLVEAPVHPDGSFFVEVPADTPLRLTLIGRAGESLASFDSGVWVRPNENRGCIGCHEEQDRVPENRAPLAVQDPPFGAAVTAASTGAAHESR